MPLPQIFNWLPPASFAKLSASLAASIRIFGAEYFCGAMVATPWLIVTYSEAVEYKCCIFNASTLFRILLATKIAQSAGADFVKSGTGTSGVVSTSQIKQMKKATRLPVKAAGGIKNINKALELLDAGASILGSSNSLKIVEGSSR